jgi:hypothetical protein
VLVTVLSMSIVVSMLAGLSLVTTTMTERAGRNAVWGEENISINGDDLLNETIITDRFVVPDGTAPFAVDGSERWLESCAYLVEGANARVSQYRAALRQLRWSNPDNRLAAMNEMRLAADILRSPLTDAGVVDANAFTSGVADAIDPLRENWVGVAYFAHVTDEDQSVLTYVNFVAAVNATTATVVPGGAHDVIIRTCLRHLQDTHL